MKFIPIFLILLLSYSNSAHSEWTNSLNDGWDKAKEYSKEGWDKTKEVWKPTNEMLSESEDTRQRSRLDQEDERFRDMWGDVFSQLKYGLAIVDEIKLAPDSAMFGDDKKSLRDDLNQILDNTLVLLEDESINDYRNAIEEFNQLILKSKVGISEYREKKITAPRTHLLKTTKEDFDRKIEDEKINIADYQAQIERIKIHLKERLQDIGLNLKKNEVNTLLSRVDADDIIQMSVIFDVLKKITNQLMQLTQDSGEELRQAKKYYGMHVVLLELVNYMQQKYIDMVEATYIPKINMIISKTINTQNNAKNIISEESDPKRITGFENNIVALDLTLKTAKLYKKSLKKQQNQVASAQTVVQKDLKLSQNTYDTVDVSADLLSVLKSSKDSFDALMSLLVPQIVPFENVKMQEKYKELSKLLKE